MLFNSTEFLQFFPVVFLLFFSLKNRFKPLFLLLASYLFYAHWNPSYLILILASTLIDFWAGRALVGATQVLSRKLILYCSLCVNLGILFVFKYFDFFIRFWSDILALPESTPFLNVILPVGISFYTFQSMSYTIDVYRKNIEAEKSLVNFSLYVAFFPQLIAGPIERASHILPQIRQNFKLSYENCSLGFRYILWGFVQKILLADRLSIFVERAFDAQLLPYGAFLWLGLFFFCFQIYFDFAAYSNIAIGLSRIFGIEIMENFNRPYFAHSIADFWRRWHISLSTWFRDYVFIPLKGSHCGLRRQMANIFVVFLLSGLWHGANYNFLIWGFLHGFALCLLVLNRKMNLIKLKIPLSLAILLTFLFVLVTWLPFRLTDPDKLLNGYLNLFRFDTKSLSVIFNQGRGLNLVLIGLVLFIEYFSRERPIPVWFGEFNRNLRLAVYYVLIFGLLALGEFGTTPFIYFQF